MRLAAPFVSVGEPVVLLAQLRKATAGVELTVQRRGDDGVTWTPVSSAATGSDGRALAALDTTVAGAQVLRVIGAGTSGLVTLTVTDGATTCTPRPALVDPQATPAARCLATRLDRWKSAGLMGVGQQLNVSNIDYLDPLMGLGGRRVSVVGFDLEELDKSANYEYPFADRVIADLTLLAEKGVVLNATWHATNPHTGGANQDRTWHSLGALLEPDTAEYQQFWADFDAKLAYLHQLQDAGVAVVFRPFHEANGDWFWWGKPKPATYKALWAHMQQRAAEAGVHNIVWGYSFNAVTHRGISDPVKLLPAQVDLAGLDSYDLESTVTGQGRVRDHRLRRGRRQGEADGDHRGRTDGQQAGHLEPLDHLQHRSHPEVQAGLGDALVRRQRRREADLLAPRRDGVARLLHQRLSARLR